MNNFDLEYTNIKERYCGKSVSMFHLEKELCKTKGKVERNKDDITRSHGFGGSAMGFLGVAIALGTAFLPSDVAMLSFMNVKVEEATNFMYGIIIIARILLILFSMWLAYRTIDKEFEENRISKNNIFSENDILRLKIEIISEEIEKRKVARY